MGIVDLQNRSDLLRIRAVLVLPDQAAPDITVFTEPVRIPVRIVWREAPAPFLLDITLTQTR